MADSTFDPATTVISDIKGDYTLDPTHSRLGFSTRHAMVTTVRGQFKEFAGEAVVDTANPTASVTTPATDGNSYNATSLPGSLAGSSADTGGSSTVSTCSVCGNMSIGCTRCTV